MGRGVGIVKTWTASWPSALMLHVAAVGKGTTMCVRNAPIMVHAGILGCLLQTKSDCTHASLLPSLSPISETYKWFCAGCSTSLVDAQAGQEATSGLLVIALA